MSPAAAASAATPTSDEEDRPRRTGAEICRAILDLLLFYTTAFFVLLAIFSIFALIFLVPFFIDPAWSTLQADFHPEGTRCTTINGAHVEGRSLCEWSSCEEGCTQTVYTCWQIMVEYELPGVRVGSGRAVPTQKGRLLKNIKGCGYPPRTNCSAFIETYATNGTAFTCFASRADPTLLIVDLDLAQAHRDLFYSLAIPVPCLIVAIIYIVIAYFYIYPDPPQKSHCTVATFSAVSAMAAMADVGIADDSEDGQRRRLLMQAQRAKLLAAHQGRTTAALVMRSAAATASTSAISAAVGAAASAGKDYVTAPRKQKSVENMQMAKVQKYRREYGQEKYSVMQYYQYYGML